MAVASDFFSDPAVGVALICPPHHTLNYYYNIFILIQYIYIYILILAVASEVASTN